MLSKDCFFDANRLLCDYYHKNTSQTGPLAIGIINIPFILVIARLFDHPAFEAQNPNDNCNASQVLLTFYIGYSFGASGGTSNRIFVREISSLESRHMPKLFFFVHSSISRIKIL